MAAWWKGLGGALAVLALAQAAGVLDGLNRWITDAHFRGEVAARPRPFPPEIVVVGIDDDTHRRLGRLRNWSRSRYAALLDRTRRARAVGLDLLFTEPDLRDPAGDRELARAVREHGRVAVPFFQLRAGTAEPGGSPAVVGRLLAKMPPLAAAGDLEALPPFRIQPPLPELVEAAAAIGYADVGSDPDGVYRRPILLRAAAGESGLVALPHLTLAVAAVALGGNVVAGPDRLRLGARTVRLSGGSLWLQPLTRRELPADRFLARGIRVAGYRPLPGSPATHIGFAEALEADPATFEGKIVLVGETASGTTDIRPNPLDNGLRGVELNAEILANLLHARPALPLGTGFNLLLIALALAAPLLLYERLAPRQALIASAAALVLLLAALEALFWGLRLVPSWSAALLGMVTAGAVMAQQRLGEEEAQKVTLRREFSSYVAPELVDRLVRDPRSAREEGTRQRVAVLFSDIRDFTRYSEQHPPEQVVSQMQEYLTEMTAAVLEPHGILDKFIGDAVMALYGPFQPEGVNRSAMAVASALDMLDRLDRINARWQEQGLPAFRVGIGIHVGEAVVGNIGSLQKKQFTALGDTVNLAARLQTATKEIGGSLLVSEAVREEAEPALGRLVEFRDLGTLAIRGREQEVRVYEARRRASAEVAPEPESDRAEPDAAPLGVPP